MPNRVNLATVVDPSTGLQVVYTPPKKHHQIGSAKTMYQLLTKSAAAWLTGNSEVSVQPDAAWSHWRQTTGCSSSTCPNADDDAQMAGFALPTGHLLCQSCFSAWETAFLAQLNITQEQPCYRDAKGTCYGCTLAASSSRTRLRHLLIRGHLRDLCYHFLGHLPSNTSNQVVCILHRELCNLHSSLDRKYLVGIPARLYRSVLGWLGWHYKTILSQPITSMPPLDLDRLEQWATVCYNKLCAVDLRPVTQKTKRLQSTLMMAHAFDQAPALRTLEPSLVDHSGLASTLLSNVAGRGLLRRTLELDTLTLPAPADNSIGRQTDARCVICKNVNADAWEATDTGLVCHNCLACKRWWHLECIPLEERDTSELADPNGRCAECIASRRYAVNRILELVRTEAGQCRLLLEYVGYDRCELDKCSALDVMDHVGKGALIEAYQRHEPTRTTRSLLHCVLALLDALDHEEPLKNVGFHVKMTHDDPKLYLVSHASLAKRGFSVGQANVYHMLASEHRLYIPFSLSQLLIDINGKALPKVPSSSARPPTLQEIVEHLHALTETSLPLALAHSTVTDGAGWPGLGLLSGSRLSDIIITLTVFATRYTAERWLAHLQTAIPGCTEQDAQWLTSLQAPVDSPMPAPQNQLKRKASVPAEPNPCVKRRLAATQSVPLRRSPRSQPTPVPTSSAAPEDEAPSQLAASHRNLRPQLSLAFRRLYGTAQHKGILACLAMLKLYCECLGTTWTGNSARDPVVFFKTADMADTSKWQRIPAEFDKTQAKAYSFAPPGRQTTREFDRSSGTGPIHGRPP